MFYIVSTVLSGRIKHKSGRGYWGGPVHGTDLGCRFQKPNRAKRSRTVGWSRTLSWVRPLQTIFRFLVHRLEPQSFSSSTGFCRTEVWSRFIPGPSCVSSLAPPLVPRGMFWVMFLLKDPSVGPAVQSRHPAPVEERQTQNMTLPPPCLTVDAVLQVLGDSLQAQVTPKSWIWISDHRTSSQTPSESFR